jgi:hypothetical protein
MIGKDTKQGVIEAAFAVFLVMKETMANVDGDRSFSS